MNYLKEINVFMDQVEMEEVSLSASMLWMSLMHFNNKSGWKKEFAVPSVTLMTKARLTESSFKRARAELKEKGFIKHTFVNRNRAPLYEMISRMNQFQDVEVSEDLDAGVSVEATLEPAPLFKRNKTKRNPEDDEALKHSNPFQFYEKNIGMLTPFMGEKLTYWCDEVSDALVIESMKRAAERNKRSFKYCEAILTNWLAQGVKTVEDVEALELDTEPQVVGGPQRSHVDDIFQQIKKERGL